MYDVVIIGAGVSGCASARELSRYSGKFLVLEKEEDVCCGTSKANSAIIHAGYDAEPGTLKAELNVKGNQMMPTLAKQLDIPFRQCGSLVVCLDKNKISKLEALYSKGIANGVEGLEIINDNDKLKVLEPNISDDAVAALYAPTAGIICPFELNLAMAENAYENGVEFNFNTEVLNITKSQNGWILSTSKGEFEAKAVVNAAGVYADKFHNMVSQEKIHITARRGDYLLLDKNVGNYVNHTIFALPDEMGKGVLISQTVDGNLIIGPTAIDINDKEATATTTEGLNQVKEKSCKCVKDVPIRQVITSFAGLRPHEDGGDFIIEEIAQGFVDCAGIESPGLASSPAIGVRVSEIVRDILHLKEKANFKETRNGIVHTAYLSKDEFIKLIEENPIYGNIVCRCEKVTEGEIIDAINRPIGAKSLDGIKRRTRAGAGRCQAGFCSSRTMEILSRELNIPMNEITKSGGKSRLILGTDKDSI